MWKRLTICSFGLLFSFITLNAIIIAAKAQTSPPTPPGFVFYSMRDGSNAPPLPENPYYLPQYPLGGGRWLVDDRQSARSILGGSTVSTGSGGGGFQALDDGPPGFGTPGTNGTTEVVTNTHPLYNYGTNLWIEIVGITNSNIYLALHGAISNYVQLQYSTNLAYYHQTNWTPGETDDVGTTPTAATNILYFQPVYMGFSQMFFRAQISSVLASVVPFLAADAVRPAPGVSAVPGYFNVTVSGSDTYYVNFSLTGSATNGIDYTNMTSPWLIMNDGGSPNYIPISPLANSSIVFDENVVMTLQPGSNYVVNPAQASAMKYIDQKFTNSYFQLVTTNISYVTGVAYHPLSNSLVIAHGGGPTGTPITFSRMGLNGTNMYISNNWTSLSFSGDEPNPIIIQTNLGGFTNSVTFFATGTNGQIGWISTNGSTSTLNWLALSNESALVTSLYADTTGVFTNRLIAITGDFNQTCDGNVWCISPNKTATLFTTITNADGTYPAVEGMITVPNDPAQYGPLAGTILIGAETPPILYSVGTNGHTTSFDFTIQPEDIHIIQTNQDYYQTYFGPDLVLKLPAALFNNYVGDVLVVQEGLGAYGSFTYNPQIYILHWDAPSATFIQRRFHPPVSETGFSFEEGTFAPISIPSTPLSDQ